MRKKKIKEKKTEKTSYSNNMLIIKTRPFVDLLNIGHDVLDWLKMQSCK